MQEKSINIFQCDEKLIECWSCHARVSEKSLAYNDGLCPSCNCEIDLEDDDDD